MFFENIEKHGDNIALIDAKTGTKITYTQLGQHVKSAALELGKVRKLIFIEAQNNINTVIQYLACLQGGHVCYLLNDLSEHATQDLISAYNPHILCHKNNNIEVRHDNSITLHENLCLLLGTSGSTGSPKFVKLSKTNIASNAHSIAQYLGLTPHDRALCHLKLSYSFGLSILNSHLAVGGSLILTDDNILEDNFWQDINKHQATSFSGVPHSFETLLLQKFYPQEYPSLRYITQAGGKLEADLVSEFSQNCRRNNIDFYVMYGQTEAAPRISYLPPSDAETYPHSIGKAIPDGELFLVNTDKETIETPDTEGELAYRGPNVMMGYADKTSELASDETPEMLYTGDLACFNSAGYFYITGRTKRIIKPFGLRINLDDIQSHVKKTHPKAIITGDDKHIIIANEGDLSEAVQNNYIVLLSQKYKLPPSIFSFKIYENFPLLSNGKYDFKAILNENSDEQPKNIWQKFITLLKDVFEINNDAPDSVLALYKKTLNNNKISLEDSFKTLEADSLSYVGLSLSLENMFGKDLPEQWQNTSIKELDTLYFHQKI